MIICGAPRRFASLLNAAIDSVGVQVAANPGGGGFAPPPAPPPALAAAGDAPSRFGGVNLNRVQSMIR